MRPLERSFARCPLSLRLTKNLLFACLSRLEMRTLLAGSAMSFVMRNSSRLNLRFITNPKESKNKFQAQELKMFREKGFPIKENSHKGFMQLKVTIADKSVVTTGSFNYTTAAITTNDEVLVVIHDPEMAKQWEDHSSACGMIIRILQT
jgi:phosphatidylserine/phosphatidylglycerophosphate/cardiolipin synthase-like enzyme